MSTTPIRPIVEMLIGSSWVDITGDCRIDSADSGGGLEVVRGVPNEGTSAEPTQFNFTLNNKDGKYSPLNPASPYWGLLGRNQRVRYGLDRRVDAFARTSGDDWGSLPPQSNPDGTTIPGEVWHYYGGTSFFDTIGNAGTITGATANKVATYGKVYGDVDVKARMKVSTRDTEFGLMLRMKPYTLVAPSGVDMGFDDSIAGWVAPGGHTLTRDTGIKHGGAASLKLTVVGSPATAGAGPDPTKTNTMYGPLTIFSNYTARLWARTSIATTVRLTLSFYKQDLSFISSAFTDTAVAANSWTVCQATTFAPTDAWYVQVSPIMQGSPPAGTTMNVDQVELQDGSAPSWYSAYVTCGTPDRLRIGKVWPGGAVAFGADLASPIVVNTWYWMRAQIAGQRLRVKLWLDGQPEPLAWGRTYYDASVDVETPDIGLTGEVGFISKDGTALMTVDNFQVDQWRAHTEIAELPPRWDLSRTDRWVPIQSRGILRRLGQGRKSLRSAVSLHLESYAKSSYGWWPLEDDTGDRAGNNVAGGIPATISGLSFATPDSFGSAALPGASGFAQLDTDTAVFNGQINPHTSSGKETILWFMRIPSLMASEQTIGTIYSSGTVRVWKINIKATGSLRVIGTDRLGTTIVDVSVTMWGNTDTPVGCWLACTLYLLQNGGNVTWALNFTRPGSSTFFSANGPDYAGSVGVYTSINFRSNAVITAAGDLRITQVMHYRGDLPFVTFDFSKAASAYDTELAGSRFLRLCANAAISASTVGFTVETIPMGPQTPSKLVDLLDECAQVEDGFVLEERDDWGLDLVTRGSRWNRRIHPMSIDSGHLSPPLDPSMDDQGTRNDVTVSRPNGGFGRAIQLIGPLNVNEPETDVDGVGEYDEQVEMNFATDGACQSMADWRKAMGTLDQPRYPSIRADLTAKVYQSDPALAAAIMSMDVGDVIDLTNPEADYLPREQAIQGYTDRIGDWYDWDIAWTATPTEPRRVGIVNLTTRVGTESNKTTTALVVNGVNKTLITQNLGVGYPWVTLAEQPAAFPFVVEAAGVMLSVVGTGQTLNKNPDGDVDASGWAATSANVVVAFDRYAPKTGYGNFRVTAVAAGTDGMVTAAADQFAVTVGASYFVGGWVASDFTQTDFRFVVDWYTAASAFISTSPNAATNPPTIGWNYMSAVVVAPATAAFGRVRTRSVFSAGGQRIWYDEVRIVPVSTTTADPQTLTVNPVPLNGIYKTIPVGTVVRVIDPHRVAW